MSTVPSNSKINPKPVTGKPAAAKPGVVVPLTPTTPGQQTLKESIESAIAAETVKNKPKVKKDRRQLKILVGTVCLVVGLTVTSVWAYFNYVKKPTYIEIALNEPNDKKGKFVTSKAFNDLEFSRQQVWMKEIADRKKELQELYTAGKIEKAEMAEILAVASLGNLFERIDRYYTLQGEASRKLYLTGLVNKEMKDKELEAAGLKPKFAVDKDKKKFDMLVAKLPPNIAKEYNEFHKNYKDVEKEIEREDKRIKREGKAATAPSTRPTTRPTERPATGRATTPVTPVVPK